MSYRSYALATGLIFLVIAVLHLLRVKRQQTRALAVFLRVSSRAPGMKDSGRVFGHSATLRVALTVEPEVERRIPRAATTASLSGAA